jgi:hypothetical protein
VGKLWQIIHRDLPQKIEIQAIILMNYDVSHSDDLTPANVTEFVASIIGQTAGSFFEAANDRILSHCVLFQFGLGFITEVLRSVMIQNKRVERF